LAQFEGYTDAWGAIGGGGGTNTFTADSFTGDGLITAYALSQTVSSEDNLLVFIEGIFQQQDAFSIATSGGTTTLTFSSAPANGNAILIYSIAAAVSGSNLNIDSMTGDGSDTTLALSIAPVNENNTQVFVDGVYQSKANYSISGTTLTFSTAPPTGSAVEVMTMTQTDINVPVDGTITSAKLSGDLTLPGDLSFADNNKAIFGAGSDLQIYHDGSHSYIKDNGTGNLRLQGATTVQITDPSFTSYSAQFNPTGAATLYHNNSAKLATTSTGIDVTGTVTADGLTVDGGSTLDALELTASSSFPATGFSLNANGFLYGMAGSQGFILRSASNSKALLNISENNDISFYEDTGTTPKLFWDASAERLGVGTTNIDGAVTAYGNSDTIPAFSMVSDTNHGMHILHRGTDGDFSFEREDAGTKSEFMRVDRSSGNVSFNESVGIGVTPYANTLSTSIDLQDGLGLFGYNNGFYLSGNGYYDGAWKYKTSGVAAKINSNSTGDTVFSSAVSGSANGPITWVDNVTITASGRVGIGVTNPGSYYAKDLVVGAADEGGITIAGGTNDQNYLMFAEGTSGSQTYRGYIGYDHPTDMMQMVTHGVLRFYNGGSSFEMGRFDSSGNFGIGVTSPNVPLHVNGDAKITGAYSSTTGFGANVFVQSTGKLFRSTSSQRYKNTIQDATHGLTELLTLRPVTYKGNNDGDLVFGGLIAEEVHDAGLTEFVQYNEEDQPDALAYGNMVSLCIKAIQEQQETITALTARIEQLENN